MQRFAYLAVAALVLAGCGTTNPHAGQYQPSRPEPVLRGSTLPRAAAPAAGPRAAPSTGIGTLAANMAGGYMDAQESELRARLRLYGVGVGRIGDDIVLNLKGDDLFGSGSERLSFAARRTLDTVAAVLAHDNKTLIDVNGYTDTTGSADANLKLSQRRAEAVAEVLVDDGVAFERISPKGFGEADLKIPTGDHVNEPRNRRIEIRIVPKVQG